MLSKKCGWFSLALPLSFSIWGAQAKSPQDPSLPPKTIILLCYPSDDTIKKSCAFFKAQMESCGYQVVQRDDFTAEESEELIKDYPSTVPVVLNAHGNSFEKKHYIDSKRGNLIKSTIGKEDPWVGSARMIPPTEEKLQQMKVFRTLPILQAMGERPKIIGSCFSGRACEELGDKKGNIVAACRADETAEQTFVLNGKSQDPVLYWIGQLYCKEKLFRQADRLEKEDGIISEVELARFLAKKMGAKQTVTQIYTPVMDKSTAAERESVEDNDSAIYTAQVEVTPGTDEEREKKAIQSAKRNPDRKKFRMKTDEGGEVYQFTNPYSDKNEKLILPGYYISPYPAQSAAKAILNQKYQKSPQTIEVESLGKVYHVIQEDLQTPCHIGSWGLPQTPQVHGTIRRQGAH